MFQSTRPARGATRTPSQPFRGRKVSIHAPRAGRDLVAPLVCAIQNVSIHAPRAGRDAHDALKAAAQDKFQSTRPARGATSTPPLARDAVKFQSTRPARGATIFFYLIAIAFASG